MSNYDNTNNLGTLGPAPDSIDGLGIKQLIPGALGNYIGPGWSNGEMQESVEWGDKEPQDELDLAAYYHDSAYAKFKDKRHRQAADIQFYEATKHLKGDLAKTARNAVVYGNNTKDRLFSISEDVATGAKYGGLAGAVGGLVYNGGKATYEFVRGLHGGYDKDAKDVRDYYATDPYKRQNMKFTTQEIKDAQKLRDQIINDMNITQRRVKSTQEAANTNAAARAEMHGPLPVGVQNYGNDTRVSGTVERGAPTHNARLQPHMLQESPVVVNDPRSFFKRIFKRKKKKRAAVLPEPDLSPAVIERQRQLFAHHQKLKRDAENSALPPSDQLPNQPFGYSGRIRRAYSTKRRAQLGR